MSGIKFTESLRNKWFPQSRSSFNQQKKKYLSPYGFSYSHNHRVKIKESETIEKYLDLTREMKMLWNIALLNLERILRKVLKNWSDLLSLRLQWKTISYSWCETLTMSKKKKIIIIINISECSKLAQKEYKARHDLVGKVIHREMCRKFQFDHTNKWYMHNPAPALENDSHKLLWGFNIQTDQLILARRPDLIIVNRKKRICKIVDFAVPADHRINLKESEKKDKYLDLARELKKLWNIKVMIVPIVIGALGTITKGLLKGLEDLEVGGWIETIQTTPLIRMARIMRRVLETWGDLLSLKLQWKTIS